MALPSFLAPAKIVGVFNRKPPAGFQHYVVTLLRYRDLRAACLEGPITDELLSKLVKAIADLRKIRAQK